MIAGLALFLLGQAAVGAGALALLRKVATGVGCVDAVLFLLLRLLLIVAVVLLAGLTGTLTRAVLGGAAAVALAALWAGGAFRGGPSLKAPAAGAALWATAAAVGLRLALQVWFFSPHLGDAVAYHLPKVAEWIRAGGFTPTMGLHPHVTFPAGFELVETWWVVFFRHDVFIEAAGVEFLLLAFAAAFALGRAAGLGEKAAFFGALLYGLTPGLHLSATSCLNDAPAAAVVVAALALAAWRVPPPLLLAAAALGCGIKPTVAFALPGVLFLAWRSRRTREAPGAAGATAWALAALAAATGAYWYVRNALTFGNPFHPLGSPGVDNPVAVQLGPRWGSLTANLADLIDVRLYDTGSPYGANVDGSAGWGAPAFACGLVAAVALWSRHRDLRGMIGAALVSLVCGLLFVQNDPWCLKYVFYVPVVLCVAAAAAAELQPAVRWIAGAGLLFSCLGTFLPYDLPFPAFRDLAAQPWERRTALAGARHLEGAATVACVGGFDVRSYLLYGPAFERRVLYLRPSGPRELAERMAAESVRVLYAPSRDPASQALIEEAVREGRLRILGEGFYELAAGPRKGGDSGE